MAGQRSPDGRGIRRVALGLLAAAALVLAAPIANASPETDADVAINQTWGASGGPTSPLGPKDGGVYPVGEGFGQNYASGKIFFTPATGARIMQGAILDKYQVLGGPADSDLGFPTIDEGAGRAPGSRNTTFSAGDKPVIFWTPDTGAHVVRGAINVAWDTLGGSGGALGVPVEDETYDGDVVTQQFTGGKLSWNRQVKTFATEPPELAGQLAGLAVPTDSTSSINAARRSAGGPLGPLGAQQGAQYAIGKDGAGQNFAGGKIFFSPATGANVVSGPVLAKYESVGGPQSDLGFPVTSTISGGLAPDSRMSTFAAADTPVIFWTPDFGAFIIRGAMNAAWSKLGGATGSLGAPIADQTDSGDVVTQRFSNGEISWDKTSQKFTTNPPNLATSLTGLQVPGQELPKAPPASTPNDNTGRAFTWHWWYWAILGAAVLVLAALVLVTLVRRRRHRNRPAEAAPAGYRQEDGHWSSQPEFDSETSVFSDDDDVEISAAPGVTAAPPASEADQDAAGPVEADDPDAVDTAPTLIQSEDPPPTGRHAAIDVATPASAGWRSAAANNPPPVAPRTALHLPLDDPRQAPQGYPIKGNVAAGEYYTPDCPSYGYVDAEIWFATEELAQANGFSKGR